MIATRACAKDRQLFLVVLSQDLPEWRNQWCTNSESFSPINASAGSGLSKEWGAPEKVRDDNSKEYN